MEIAALGRLPRAFTHLFGDWGHAGSTFGKRAQLIRTVDKPLGYEVDDQSLPFDAAVHLQKLRRHHNPAVPGEDLGPHHYVGAPAPGRPLRRADQPAARPNAQRW